MTTTPLPEQIELHRDRMWRRDEDLRIESAVDAERFIEKKPKPGSGLRFVRFSINKSHGEILCEPGSPQLVLAANSYFGEMNNRATVEPKCFVSLIAIMTRCLINTSSLTTTRKARTPRFWRPWREPTYSSNPDM